MYKKFMIFLICIMVLSSCTSTNEDPTNIELEVLRVSLLEKELIIDELHQSLDENNRQNKTLLSTIEDLETRLSREEELNSILLEGQPQVLTVQDESPHFYELIGETLYLLTVHENEEFDYSYEELHRYVKDEADTLVYKGSKLQFKVGEKTSITTILDNEKFRIIDKDLQVRYEYDIDLNDPLIELTPTLYIDNYNKQESYVLLWKYIEEDIPSLYSVISFDYHNIDDIEILQHNLVTQQYEIEDSLGLLIYVDPNQEINTLVRLDLSTGDKEIILQNQTEPFSMYKNNGNIYYFDEKNGSFIRYDNN